MLIADTTLSGGIAIVEFAAVLFLILFGIVYLLKWFFRWISGKPNPAKLETVSLVFEIPENANEQELREEIDNFVWYLQPKLAAKKIGLFHSLSIVNNELVLQIRGFEAECIWGLIEFDLTKKSPCKPLRVIMDRSEIHGGQMTIDCIPWTPESNPSFQVPSKPEIPKHWLFLSRVALALMSFGVLGIFVWEAIQRSKDLSENQIRNTGLGSVLAYLFGTTLIAGLSLGWLSSRRIQVIQKGAGFSCGDSLLSTTLKYVLLMVIVIFGLILFIT